MFLRGVSDVCEASAMSASDADESPRRSVDSVIGLVSGKEVFEYFPEQNAAGPLEQEAQDEAEGVGSAPSCEALAKAGIPLSRETFRCLLCSLQRAAAGGRLRETKKSTKLPRNPAWRTSSSEVRVSAAKQGQRAPLLCHQGLLRGDWVAVFVCFG